MNKNSAIKRWIMFLVVFATVLGTFCGVIWGNSIENLEYDTLQVNIERYSTGTYKGSKIEAFCDALFKYGKHAFYIWFLGFISIGLLGVLCIMFSKGLGIGFTTGIILRMFDAGQAAELILSYTLQSLILLPIYALLTYKSIDFILKYSKQDKEKHNSIIKINMLSYTVSYIFCCLPIILACIVEASF